MTNSKKSFCSPSVSSSIEESLSLTSKLKASHRFSKTPTEQAHFLFCRTCQVLNLSGFSLGIMKRRLPVKDTKKPFRVAYINLKSKKVVIDIYTPKKRLPKKPSVILRNLAHELAHCQKPPYRQLYRGKIINRIHYPAFYRRVNKNIKLFKKDKILRQFFT